MTSWVRVYALTLAVVLLWILPGRAEQLSLASETIFRAYKLDRRDRSQASAAPLYEYLRVNYASREVPGLTMNLNGWGRLNLAENAGDKPDNSAGELLNTYLQYAPPKQNYQLRVGRQYVFEGVARDNLDGVYGKLQLLPGTGASLYAGVPTMLESTTGRKNDLIYGGRLTYSVPRLLDAGISYKHTLDNGVRRDNLLGGDMMVYLPGKVTLLGHSTYDLISDAWGEQSWEARVPVGPVMIQPFFQRYRYNSYFSNNRNGVPPFRFLENSGNVLTAAGSDFFWYPSDRGEVAFRFKNYYYRERFRPTQFYSLIANRRWNILNEAGVELGRMQGREAVNRYMLSRAYAYLVFAPGFVTGDVTYVYYDRSIYGKSSSMFASLGAGRGFFKDSLSVKVSVDYNSDPYFKSDYRVTGKVSYQLDRIFYLRFWKK